MGCRPPSLLLCSVLLQARAALLPGSQQTSTTIKAVPLQEDMDMDHIIDLLMRQENETMTESTSRPIQTQAPTSNIDKKKLSHLSGISMLLDPQPTAPATIAPATAAPAPAPATTQAWMPYQASGRWVSRDSQPVQILNTKPRFHLPQLPLQADTRLTAETRQPQSILLWKALSMTLKIILEYSNLAI